jgi:hypothetical protein
MTTLVNSQIPSIQVNIRSDDVEITADPTRSDLTCRFSRPITIPAGIKTFVTLASAQVPHSFYAIPSDTLITFTLATTGAFIVTVPAGTYSVSEWNTKINTLLTPADAPTFSTIRVSLKQQVPSPPGGWQVTAISANSGQVLRMFGESALPFGPADGAAWISTNVPDASGHHNLQIASNLPTGSIDSNNDQRSNILAKIPINSPFGSMILYTGSVTSGVLLDTRAISQVRLAIVDHEGQLLNLNGVRWNASLLLQFIVTPAYGQTLASKRTPIITEYKEIREELLLKKRAALALKKLDTTEELDEAIGRNLPAIPE